MDIQSNISTLEIVEVRMAMSKVKEKNHSEQDRVQQYQTDKWKAMGTSFNIAGADIDDGGYFYIYKPQTFASRGLKVSQENNRTPDIKVT